MANTVSWKPHDFMKLSIYWLLPACHRKSVYDLLNQLGMRFTQRGDSILAIGYVILQWHVSVKIAIKDGSEGIHRRN
jgi:hypothetical protein